MEILRPSLERHPSGGRSHYPSRDVSRHPLSGLLIGSLPGLGLILLASRSCYRWPVGLGGTAAIACLAGVYYGSMFGGAITSILLGIPGDAPSVMTVIDGYPMAQKGEAGRALAWAYSPPLSAACLA